MDLHRRLRGAADRVDASHAMIGQYRLELKGDALVTLSFLTLAFAQLFHVFKMRGRRSPALVNAVTRNPYVWGAVVLCTGILARGLRPAPRRGLAHRPARSCRLGAGGDRKPGASAFRNGKRCGRSPCASSERKRQAIIADARVNAALSSKLSDARLDASRVALHDATAAMREDRSGDSLASHQPS